MKDNIITENKELYNDLDVIEDVNKRYRNFSLILYKDSESYSYNDVLRILKSYKNYAYIEHQPDTQNKKVHTHFFLRVDNNCTIKSLSKKIGLQENYIQNVISIRAFNRYLTHIDSEEEKTKYDINDVVVSKCWQRNFLNCYDDRLTEDEILIKIYNYLDDLCITTKSYPNVIKCLTLWVYQNCYDSVYRKFKFEFDNYIKSII